MEYKMILTDLDDSLLNDEKKVSPVDKKAIKEAMEKGIKFVLASGRPTYAMWDLAHELELDKYDGYLLSFNGSIITNAKTKENIFKTSLSSSDLHLMYDFAKKHNAHILTYTDDSIISETDSKYIDVEVDLSKMKHLKVKSFKDFVNFPATKCMILDEPKRLKEIEILLKKEYGDKYTIAISKPFFLEITKPNIDKGIALEKLAKFLNIDIAQTIALGDSYNDIPMLEKAGLPVCVSNANDDIKKICKYITTSNNDGGMANLIHKFIK